MSKITDWFKLRGQTLASTKVLVGDTSNLAQEVATTGTGSVVLATAPTLSAPVLGTPASGNLVNCTGYPGGGSGTVNSGTATHLAYYATSTTAVSDLTPVATNVGSFTNANITVNANGLVTAAANGTAGSGSGGGLPTGRLTLTTGTPITTADVTGATNLYYTPFLGNTIQLWDGAAWTTYTYTEITHALGTVTSGKAYDIFGYQSSSTLAIEKLVWTNDTTRATDISLQDGRYCKVGDKTRLYLGTIYTTSTTATEDSVLNRYVWNMYNRVSRQLQLIDATSPWTISSGTVRQANSNTANKFNLMCGLAGIAILDVRVSRYAVPNAAGLGSLGFAFGEDSVTVQDATCVLITSAGAQQTTGTANNTSAALLRKTVPVGKHYYAWLEWMVNVNGTISVYATTAVPQKDATGTFDA